MTFRSLLEQPRKNTESRRDFVDILVKNGKWRARFEVRNGLQSLFELSRRADGLIVIPEETEESTSFEHDNIAIVVNTADQMFPVNGKQQSTER